MNAKKILFPTDFSTASDAALDYASALAKDMGATLLIAHVEEAPMAYGGGELYYGATDPDQNELNRMLKNLVPRDASIPCERRLLSGSPAVEIVSLAALEGVDLIVMGTHGRTGLKRLLMGSIAEAVVRRSTCPVFTLREPVSKSSVNVERYKASVKRNMHGIS